MCDCPKLCLKNTYVEKKIENSLYIQAKSIKFVTIT